MGSYGQSLDTAPPPSADTLVPGGSNTHIQFNDNGELGGSPDLAWKNSRLGIGTSNPLTDLHIVNATDALLRVTSGDGSSAFIDLGTSSNPTAGRLIYDSGGNYLFYSNSIERMRLTNGGNVGFGTTNPLANLHVQSAYDTVFRVTAADGYGSFIDIGNASNPTSGRIIYDTGNNLLFYSNSTERFRITSAGKVGFGSYDPQSRVHIESGSSTEKNLILRNAASQSVNSLELQASDATVNTYFDEDGSLVVNNSQQVVSPLRVKTSSQAYALYIASSGRLCINTSKASSDLNIGGTGIVSAFGTANQLRNFNTIRTGSSGAARLTINAGEIQIGGDVGATTLSLIAHNTTGTALGIKQKSGGSTKLIKLVDENGSETMGLTTTGFTQAGSGNGMARFDMNHTVSPSSIDGDGVGIALRTENASGTLRDVAYIDAVFTDISSHQADLVFSLKDDSGASSNPIEVFKIDHDGVPTVNQAYTLPNADGTADQVLTTDGSGAATWQDVGGGGGATVTTMIPIPTGFKLDDANDTIQINANTTAHFAHYNFSSGIDINHISTFVHLTFNTGGIDIGIYSEDGQTKHFEVTTANMTSIAAYKTNTASEETLPAGNYYIGIVTNSEGNLYLNGYSLDTDLLGSDVSEAFLCGTMTVTAGTLPSTFDPKTDLTQTSKALFVRFDN